PRSGLDVTEAAPDLKRALGNFGHVTPLATRNVWIVRGNVATLLDILPEFEAPTDPVQAKAEENDRTLTHKCKYILASSAEVLLKQALGAQTYQIIKKAPQDQGTPGGGGGPGGRGEFVKGGGPGGGQPQQQPTSTTLVQQHNVTSDRATNTVI